MTSFDLRSIEKNPHQREFTSSLRLPDIKDARNLRLTAIAAFILACGLTPKALAQVQTDKDLKSQKPDIKRQVKTPSTSEYEVKELSKQIAELSKQVSKLTKKVEEKNQKQDESKLPLLDKVKNYIGKLIDGSPVDLALVIVGFLSSAYLYFRSFYLDLRSKSHGSLNGNILIRDNGEVRLQTIIYEPDITSIWPNAVHRKRINIADKRASREKTFPFLKFRTEIGKKLLKTLRAYASANCSDSLEDVLDSTVNEFNGLKKRYPGILVPKGVQYKDIQNPNNAKFAPEMILMALSSENIKNAHELRAVMLPLGQIPSLLIDLDKWLIEKQTEPERILANLELSVATVLSQMPGFTNIIETMCYQYGTNALWGETLKSARDLQRILVLDKNKSSALILKYLHLKNTDQIQRKNGFIQNEGFVPSYEEQLKIDNILNYSPKLIEKSIDILSDILFGQKNRGQTFFKFTTLMFVKPTKAKYNF